MTYDIIKNKKMQMSIPTFICDYELNDNLKKYPMLSHLNTFTFDALIGKPGSGKTSLIIAMLSNKGENKIYRKVFNNVLLVMPSSSIKSLKKNIFKDHDEEKMYNELNIDSINDIYNKLVSYSEDNETTLLIMDDVGASLKNNEIQKILKTIIYNRRHLRVKIVMLCQSFLSIPREIRKLINNTFMWKPSKVEMENFINELFESKRDNVLDLLQLYKNKNDYLMLNVDTQKIYTNFDEIIFKN